MPSRGQSITIQFTVWDITTNTGVTGDAANLTLRWVKDGTIAELTGSPTVTEVDDTYAPGLYKVTVNAADCTCHFGTLCGISGTANAVVIPVHVTFEQLPTAVPGNNAGIARVQDIGTAPTSSAIASAVWSYLTQDIATTGSIGEYIVIKGSLITSAGLQMTGIPAGVNNVIELYKGDIRTLVIDYDATTNAKPIQADPGDNGSLANYKVSVAISKLPANTATFTGAMDHTQIDCDVVDVGLATQEVVFAVDTALWVPSINPWAAVGDWVKGQETYAYQWELVVSNGHDGTAQAGTSTTITLAADAAAEDDFYNGRSIRLDDGTGAGEDLVTITDYVGSTKVATVASWPNGTPDNTTVYKILPTICEVVKAGFFHVRNTSKSC